MFTLPPFYLHSALYSQCPVIKHLHTVLIRQHTISMLLGIDLQDEIRMNNTIAVESETECVLTLFGATTG